MKVYKKIIFIILMVFIFSDIATAIQWPGNAKSAVSISADDGWPTQLIQANILESFGFRGTFYLTAGGMPSVITNKNSWQEVFQRGHEIGNHSYSHWNHSILAKKTWQEVASDVGNMEGWLLANIFLTPSDHTYAYPEGDYIIGSQASFQSQQVGACEYAALLSAVVTGARTVEGDGENNPNTVANLRFHISGIPIDGDDETAFNNAKLAIDNGIANNSWTVLIFHSLGDSGDGYSISQAAYTKIINYLYLHQTELWVAPVVKVKNYIMANTQVSDWNCQLPK